MLTNIIAAEIINDAFYNLLSLYACRTDLKSFIEIGSSSGAGSTKAFVSGLNKRIDRDSTKLFCMELSQERFSLLKEEYRLDEFVKVYNQSSVARDEFPTESEVRFFYENTRTNLNQFPVETVLTWLKEDIQYMEQSGLVENGIEIIKREHGIKQFDMALIDGSEFTGERELYHLMGTRVIALDDVNAHKCFNAYRILSNHVSYSLAHQNFELRNGYAIFERKF